MLIKKQCGIRNNFQSNDKDSAMPNEISLTEIIAYNYLSSLEIIKSCNTVSVTISNRLRNEYKYW